MTAEQALIEENKKDPRVRYITEDSKLINLWSIKPFFDSEFNVWVGIKVTLISSLKYQNFSDFKDKDSIDCILCIDDITPEVPPIPEKWSLRVNKDTIIYINKIREEPLDINKYAFVNNCGLKNGVYGHDCIESNYPEITLEQFKKYVLGSEEKQEEIQEPNYSLDCTDSYEKSGSIGSVEFSGKYIKTGRIISADMNADPFASINNDIAFEFYDKKYWIEDRINYISQFIKRTIDSDLCINPEWISERNELIEKLKNL